jgi:hypothetical protein
MTQQVRLVGLGVGAALAVALPAALIAQVLDALSDDGLPGALTAVLAVFVLLGRAAGGWVVSTRPARPSLLIAAVVGLVAVALVEALGVARRSVAGGDVAWGGVAAVVAFGVVLAVVGGALGRRTVGRSQPAAPPAARTRP